MLYGDRKLYKLELIISNKNITKQMRIPSKYMFNIDYICIIGKVRLPLQARFHRELRIRI